VIATKWQRYRRRCKVCGAMFGCWKADQPTCSRRCGGLFTARQRAGQLRAGARKGVATAARNRFRRCIAEVLAAWPAMPAEAQRAIFRYGQRRYQSGMKTGRQAGYRLGWAAACGETPERAA
jgi:hypothetical protein